MDRACAKLSPASEACLWPACQQACDAGPCVLRAAGHLQLPLHAIQASQPPSSRHTGRWVRMQQCHGPARCQLVLRLHCTAPRQQVGDRMHAQHGGSPGHASAGRQPHGMSEGSCVYIGCRDIPCRPRAMPRPTPTHPRQQLAAQIAVIPSYISFIVTYAQLRSQCDVW
jgi:hypothetical protein